MPIGASPMISSVGWKTSLTKRIFSMYLNISRICCCAGDAAGGSLDDGKLCTGCEDSAPATSFCADCSEWLCDGCVQAHKRVRVTKDHNVMPKDSVTPR